VLLQVSTGLLLCCVKSFVTLRKNKGIKKMVKKVAANTPPTVPVPTACWLADEAPELNANDKTPKINANDVIKIGRNLKRQASIVASYNDLPSLRMASSANSTTKIAFLAAKPIVVNKPTWK